MPGMRCDVGAADDATRVMVGAGLIAGYLAIALLTTDGGWGWHWGD